jgi:hypothetical protein
MLIKGKLTEESFGLGGERQGWNESRSGVVGSVGMDQNQMVPKRGFLGPSGLDESEIVIIISRVFFVVGGHRRVE